MMRYVNGEVSQELVTIGAGIGGEKEHWLLREEEVILFLLQILSVLCHRSDHGVAHRDLKLNNIMWERAEELRLIDLE
jgi:serine/threonine protein kinase